jgi:peptidoglycan hydrolase-like protein with peptidoglycan-binding domain
MVTFTRPSPVTRITGSFAAHVARGSVNPGVDYGAASGSPVYSPEAGVVAATAWSNSVGWWVTIFFDNGWSADLLHNTRITVSAGQRVARGQQVAVSGGTGSSATGPHIHWSLRPNHTTGLVNRGNVDGEQYVGGTTGAGGTVGSDVTHQYIKDQLGVDYVRALQRQLGVTDDGIVGAQTVKAWQAKVGTPADGIWGHQSNRALQTFLGIGVDGLWGPATTAAIKLAIDTGKFGAAPTPPNTRTVLGVEVNVRTAPSSQATKTGVYAANSVVELPYFTRGESVSNVDIWFVDASKTKFAWAGGFTSQNTAGMTEITVAEVPKPKWPTEKYSFAPAGNFVTRVAPADWSNFENEYSVPDPASRKGFPAKPTSVVLHQWGNPNDYTISSVINTFQARHEDPNARVSAHFVVNDDEIVQMVSLDHRAYHAGPAGNDFVGIEIDPRMTPATIANVRKVLEFLRSRNDNAALTNVLHKSLAATSCGTWIEPHLNALTLGPTDPQEPTDPSDDVIPAWYRKEVEGLIEYLRSSLETS